MPDSIEQLQADMTRDPNVAPLLKPRTEEMVREFLDQAVRFSVQWQTMDDPWEAQAILTDALIWVREANKRIDKVVAANRRPKSTAEAFRR